MNNLLIIDAHAVLHRAYHSIPPLTTNGQPVNAIYGFYSMLLSALDQLQPKYLIVCLDSPGPTFRQTEFIGYRAKRKAPEYNLISQLPLLPQTLEIANITSFAIGGYEADDLIATVVRRSLKKNKNLTVTIITGDKDLMQLVGDRVKLFMPLRGLSETKTFGSIEVKEKLGVTPDQVIDLKALMGDMSDNYPGVTGIGPVVATDLLTQYHHLDNIYSHLADIKPAIAEKLTRDRDNAYLSQKLATLIDNIPLKFSLKSSLWSDVQVQGLLTLFDQYHFKSLSSRLNKQYGLKLITKPEVDTNQGSLF